MSPHTYMATAMAGIIDYDLYASFIVDNGFNFYIINHFYRDCLTNIQSAQDVNIWYDSNVTPVKLIDDAYYNVYN